MTREMSVLHRKEEQAKQICIKQVYKTFFKEIINLLVVNLRHFIFTVLPLDINKFVFLKKEIENYFGLEIGRSTIKKYYGSVKKLFCSRILIGH